MNVIIAKGELPDRDSDLSQIPRNFFKKTNLSVYRKSSHMKISRQVGPYKSRQGSSITPVPLWAVEFQTIRRKTEDAYQTLPEQEKGQYIVKTARWALAVTGTGVEKEKWRKLTVSGPCSFEHLFATVTSAWLVPFALAHRYLVYIPAEVKGKGKSATIMVRHDLASEDNGMDEWVRSRKQSDSAIKNWTINAQKEWSKNKTQKSSELVTERLDYQSTLSGQRPNAFRVVHTRSRSFYAAVLDPKGSTALGLTFDSAKIRIVEGGENIKVISLPTAGVICDNLLHSIEVDSEDEAYWMMGLFNSESFNKLVMKQARGEPPGIYTIPVKVMEHLGLVYDSANSINLELAKIAKILEVRMKKTIRNYIADEKGLDLNMIDDTDKSLEVPSTISSALMRRLDAQEELDKLNKLADKLLED
jgi:hypothetical protein